ncbi:MAG: hypothetical protein IH946_01995 [Bacteroidetes bacterium]|nr:hypothetical protein [Bacteroidota bacterium]
MEREKSQLNVLSETDQLVLAETYFVITLESIANETDLATEDITNSIQKLLELGFVKQLEFDDEQKDYVERDEADPKLDQFRYVATKKGLLAANSR